MRNLSRLVSYLMQTYRIPAQNVVGHRDTKPTDCPGRYVNVASIRNSASAALASGDFHVEADTDETSAPDANTPDAAPAQTAASVELLTEIPH